MKIKLNVIAEADLSTEVFQEITDSWINYVKGKFNDTNSPTDIDLEITIK